MPIPQQGARSWIGRRSTGPSRWLIAVVPLMMLLAACAGDVTESSEYQTLQGQLEAKSIELDAAQDELSDVQSEVDGLESSIAEANASLA